MFMSNKNLANKIIAIFLISLFLLILPTNNDSTYSRTTYIRKTYPYKPPKKLKRAKAKSVGTGSRGCADANLAKAKLRLLAPKDHIGQSVSGYPTFFWYIVTKSPIKVNFVLVDPEKIEPIIEVQQNMSETGIGRFQLPHNIPELEQGKSYRWVVSLVCNEKKPSQNIYAYSWLERVPQTTALKQQLALHNTSSRAAIYAQQGIWYDALAEAFKYKSSSQAFLSLVAPFSDL